MAKQATQTGNDDKTTVLAQQLMALFPCSQRSFATWDPASLGDPDDRGKRTPKYITLSRAITVDDWAAHLSGQRAVVVPLRCDDDTTKVTLLDVDKYDVDPAALLKKVKLLGLPLYLSLSKSGGPHIVAFHDAPITVADSVRLAKELVRRLGLSGHPVEIFPPRQQPGVLAKDVNMPFFGGERGYLRLAPDGTLEPIPAAEFLATVVRMTAEQRAGLLATAPGDDDAGRGAAFAGAMLERYKQELAALERGGQVTKDLFGRNAAINRAAFHLATMAARGWINEDRIEDELLAVTDAAGWDNRRKTEQSVRGAIRAGLKQPHEDLNEHFANNLVAVLELNRDYALVVAGDKTAVLNERPDRFEFRLLTVTAFSQWFANRFVTVRGSEDKDDKRVPLAKFWLTHRQRREYGDLVFRPNQETPGAYNLWRGFAVKPVKGDCSKFLAHLRDNVCRGDDELYRWVIAWWADIAQRPASKCGTSLAVRGESGAGKSKVGEYMASVFGAAHFIKVADPRYVTGRFNSHLASCLVLHADEGFWAGDRSAEGKLKDMVTGTDHWLEYKGKEAFRVNNYLRLFVTGNPDWVVPAAFGERRFAVLEIGEEHVKDYAYFAAIDDEMRNGGSEALLYHLLHEVDCSQVNLREVPQTAALLEQKVASMTAEQAWWLDILKRGVLPGDSKGEGVAANKTLYGAYITHARDRGVPRRMSETALGMFLAKCVPGPPQKHRPLGKDGKRGSPQRVFPPLADCREQFARLLRAEGRTEELQWEGDDDWGCDERYEDGDDDRPGY